jgi:hypothetical protein
VALPPITGRTTQLPAPAGQPASAARSAAQRAFFDAALVKAAPAAATVRTAAAQPTAAANQARAVQPAVTRLQNETVVPPHPGRLLRPGSLVDIKV